MHDHGYQDIINEVDTLCNLFLHACFSALASSPMDIQYVQGLSTLPVRLRSTSVLYHHKIPQLLYVPSTCKPWKIPPGQLYWSFDPSELGSDDWIFVTKYYFANDSTTTASGYSVTKPQTRLSSALCTTHVEVESFMLVLKSVMVGSQKSVSGN
jgi:hypothetical protein